MNHPSDIDRVMQAWMADGPTAIPDRVVDVVAARIGVEHQRRGWPFLWRPPMNPLFKFGAAAAAVLVVAVVAWNLLPGGSGPGGLPSPTPQPSPTAAPSGSPTATGPVDLLDGSLAAGQYRIQDPSGHPGGPTIVANVPAGWIGHPDVPAVTSPAENNDGILISFMETDGLFKDACHWDVDGTKSATHGDVVVGPTVEDLVAALKANTSYTSSAATPVTLGGFDGQQIELQLPGSDVLAACDRRPGQSTGDYFVFPNGFYAQGPNSRWHLYILDVDGTRLITMVSQAEGTPAADITAAEAIVASFEFTQ